MIWHTSGVSSSKECTETTEATRTSENMFEVYKTAVITCQNCTQQQLERHKQHLNTYSYTWHTHNVIYSSVCWTVMPSHLHLQQMLFVLSLPVHLSGVRGSQNQRKTVLMNTDGIPDKHTIEARCCQTSLHEALASSCRDENHTQRRHELQSHTLGLYIIKYVSCAI